MEASATTCSIALASGTAPFVALIIKGPGQQYGFSLDDLQAWPDSMLARAVVDTATDTDEGARHARGKPVPVVWQLQSMPKCPLTAWPEAAAVVHSLYRHQYITPDILTTVLEGAVGKAPDHYKGPYQQLAELLLYLDLPGTVSRWLPPVSLLRISHFNVLTFLSNQKELELDYKIKVLAEHAIREMLSYQPYGAAMGTSADNTSSSNGVMDNQSVRLAAFAVAFDACNGLDEPLTVLAVDGLASSYGLTAIAGLAASYGRWLDQLKAGTYSEADIINWGGYRVPPLWEVKGRDVQFAKLTHGTTTPLPTAEVGIHQFVDSDTVPPGTPHRLGGYIKVAFGHLAGGTALTLMDFNVRIVDDPPGDIAPSAAPAAGPQEC